MAKKDAEQPWEGVPEGMDPPPEFVKGAPTPTKPPKQRVSDVVPSGLWPEIPQSDLRDTLDMEIYIDDVAFLMGDYGEFVVILYRMPDTGNQYTVACGGMVVVRKLKDVKKASGFPITGKITKEGRYYDIE